MKFFLLVLFTGLLVACEKSDKDKREESRIYHSCVERGVEYFKEIGSWPTLKSPPNKGRHAIEVAQERCKRQPKTAF
ncbi:hypothetical protein [Pleionea mediterranea]|uniref:Lipoprotein n=1 Tax=Pleionea mediterranea TaxID=523701 RepID=A0A316FVW8_9GAMM|nr:hypothetical protein [Pleionea mediterranea]PWK52861.1 hypothetical protein C8D97_10479 [Pleionea mediterranea]